MNPFTKIILIVGLFMTAGVSSVWGDDERKMYSSQTIGVEAPLKSD